jgi:hypothetical protein
VLVAAALLQSASPEDSHMSLRPTRNERCQRLADGLRAGAVGDEGDDPPALRRGGHVRLGMPELHLPQRLSLLVRQSWAHVVHLWCGVSEHRTPGAPSQQAPGQTARLTDWPWAAGSGRAADRMMASQRAPPDTSWVGWGWAQLAGWLAGWLAGVLCACD